MLMSVPRLEIAKSVVCLLFADDLVLLSSTESGLQRAINSFADACNTAGMKISTAKTEVLHLSRNPDQCVLQVNGATLKQVEKCKYLGVAFTSDGRQDEELDTRIGKASAVMRALHQRWKSVGSTSRSGCWSGRDSSTGRSSRLKHRSNYPLWLLKDIYKHQPKYTCIFLSLIKLFIKNQY